jgi:hypothetical protein
MLLSCVVRLTPIAEVEGIGVTPYVPKPLTSGSKAKGRFGKQDFTLTTTQTQEAILSNVCLPAVGPARTPARLA